MFLWRLDAFSLTQSPAFRIDDERFLFSPLGNDMQLFTRPESETDISHLAEPINVPEPISRRVLDSDLERLLWRAEELVGRGGGQQHRYWDVKFNVCNLSDDGASWAHLPESDEQDCHRSGARPHRLSAGSATGEPPENVRVTFHYGFSMAMGGGEYERRKSFLLTGSATTVTQGQSLQAAIDAVAGGGIVEIGDSGRYQETIAIKVGADKIVELRAANEHRPALILVGNLDIELNPGAELTLNGLLIAGGRLRISSVSGTEEKPPVLRLRHCTLVPGVALTRAGEPVAPNQPSLVVEPSAEATIEIDSCIVGALRSGRGVTVKLTNSIVDATAADHVAFADGDDTSAGGILSVVNSTVIGRVHTARLDLASNAIFLARPGTGSTWTHPVISDQNQQGCVRFSVLPLNSIVPRRYRCQPDLAVTAALTVADVPKGSLSNAKRQAITLATQARLRPAFTTLRYGQPGYWSARQLLRQRNSHRRRRRIGDGRVSRRLCAPAGN